MIKAVIFDLDGTLIDSENFYILGTIEWLSKMGINIDFKTACGILGKTMEDIYSYLEKITGIEKSKVIELNENYFNNVNPPIFNKLLFKDVKPCIEQLKEKGFRICICSMSPKNYIKEFIDDCKLNDYVDSYYSGYECINTKPDPEIYIKAIKELNLSPKEVLIVEDAITGIRSGIGSGAYVVARNSAKFGVNQDDALCVLEDLKELNTIIMEINNGKYD